MPSEPCIKRGKLGPDSYCRAHLPSRFNKALRGSGGKAATFRRRTLKITGGVCAVCGSRDGVEAHHLGERDEDGGVPLCLRHHRQVTAAENKARAKLRAR